MPEMSYERINDYATISISLASPNDIRSWSHGEVKTPETINYRTYRPEKDGLFCERIFGPERDWECNCGKFKGIKYKDIICDRCGVKITHSKVRRSRMGHINLAVPVVHIWFFRAMPSRLGTLLGIKSTGLQQIIYFQRYAVLKSGTPPAVLPANLECRKCQACPQRDSCDKSSCSRVENFSSCAECKACAKAAQTKSLKPRDLLNEEEHKFVTHCSNRCNRTGFVAEMGAEAVRAMLEDLDLEKEEGDLRAELRRRRKSTFSAVKYFIDKGLLKDKEDGKWEEPDTEEELKRFAAAHMHGKDEAAVGAAIAHISQEGMAEPTRLKTETLVKRLRLIQALRSRSRMQDSERDPKWMVMDVVPVIPPDLRPLVPLDSGNFATSDLNDLYRRVIYRNNRLAKLLDLNAPSVIVRNEKRMLQQAVDALFDNSRCRRPVQGAGNRPLKSLTDMIKGKQGRFRANLLGKRVDYSARSVIIVGPELRIDQVGLPKKIALELFQPFIIRALKERGLADTIKSAKTMLERKDAEIWDVLETVIEGHPVMLNRAPTLHRMGIQAFYPVLVEGDAIRIHPLVCSGFNADFDGDQMAVHLPLTVEAQTEASLLMISAANIFSPAHGNPVITADLDIVLGGYYLTLMRSGLPGGWLYADVADAMAAYEGGKLHLCAPIAVRVPDDLNHIRMRPAGSGAKGMAAGDDAVLERMDTVPNTNARMLASNPDELKIFLRSREMRGNLGAAADRLPPVDTSGEDWRAGDDSDTRAARPYVITTIGRLLFKELLPMTDVLYNYPMNKRSLNRVVSDCHVLGRSATVGFLDDMKEAGFHYATLSGVSFAAVDLRTPATKPKIIAAAEEKVAMIMEAHQGGDITEGERYNQIVDAWTHVSEEILKDLLVELRGRGDSAGAGMLNPIWAMFDSGARGSTTQIRQLAGFRGLMSKPNGRIIETPIRANFREGLRGLEYFSSTHGARKGLADTALKTADSGYLTRKLVEVAQDVTITALDCGTENFVEKRAVMSGEHEEVSLADNILGRVSRDNISDKEDRKIVGKGELITREIAQAIQALDLGKVNVRSPLTCDMPYGMCAKCYGMDLSTGRLVEAGTAVGVIAAQSIGEPGTQLTMRTFHIGGIASHAVTEAELRATVGGRVKFKNLRVVKTVRNNDGADQDIEVVLNRNGEMVITNEHGAEIDEPVPVPAGALLLVKEGDTVKPRQVMATWDAYNTPLLTEKAGTIRFEDIIDGKTMRTETDASGFERKIIAEHRGEQQPQISVLDKNGHVIAVYSVPEKAHLRVEEGEEVIAGQELARTPREVGTTQDITGGLPRVTELFEARRPKDPAVMAEVKGVVTLGERRRGKRQVLIQTEDGRTIEQLVPQGKHIRVQNGDHVLAGEPLVEGPLVPHDILAVNGVEALQNYLLNEIQKVYRSQNVRINDKHIEIITRQMLAKVKVEDPGDSPFLLTDSVSLATIRRVNAELIAAGQKPARYVPILQGVARASLSSDSVIAAASFQETTRVLTDGALGGRRDHLRGLKENVLIGRMIPAGTGYSTLRKAQVRTVAPAVEAMEPLGTAGLPDSDLETVLDIPAAPTE